MRLLSWPAAASLAISVGGNTAGLAVRYHDVSFASTHHHCRFSVCKGRRSVIQAAVMRSEILKTAAGSRPRPAPWPRGIAPPTRVCFLVRVSLVFRRTQCFAENVWVKAANVAKFSYLRHLDLFFLLEVLLVATEGGLCILGYRLATAGVVKALGGVDASLCKMSTVNLSSYVWCCVHVVAVEPRRFRQ